jgi:transcriptional regulator with XRE-family HTH domain
METIGEYLTRLMRQKNLTAKELADRCGLTDSYIGRLCKSTYANLTVDTIKKLATAFEVDAHEVFTAASGVPASQAPQIDLLLLLDAMQKLINHPIGFDLLRQLLEFSSGDCKQLLDYLEYFKRAPAKSKSKPGKRGRPRKK